MTTSAACICVSTNNQPTICKKIDVFRVTTTAPVSKLMTPAPNGARPFPPSFGGNGGGTRPFNPKME